MAKNNKSNPFTEIKDRIKLYKKSNGQWVSSMTKLGITFATVATLSAVSIGVSADTTTPTADATQTTQTTNQQTPATDTTANQQTDQSATSTQTQAEAKSDAQTTQAQATTPEVKADVNQAAQTDQKTDENTKSVTNDQTKQATDQKAKANSNPVTESKSEAAPAQTKSDNASALTAAPDTQKAATASEKPETTDAKPATQVTTESAKTTNNSSNKADTSVANQPQTDVANNTPAAADTTFDKKSVDQPAITAVNASQTNNTDSNVSKPDMSTNTASDTATDNQAVPDAINKATADQKSSDQAAKSDASNVKTDDATQTDSQINDLTNRVAPETTNDANQSVVTPVNPQTQKADDSVNVNVKNLVLATQNDATQDYTYDESTGNGTYGTAGFHYDQATGILTFNGGGQLAATSTNSNWWSQIGNHVKEIDINGKIQAPVNATYLFAASDHDLVNSHSFYSQLKTIKGLENVDTSQTTSLGSVFLDANLSDSSLYDTNLRGLDPSFIDEISNWDVSNVTDFDGVFRSAKIKTPEKLANWNVSKGTSFINTFNNSGLINLTGLENWDVSHGISFHGMFQTNKLNDLSVAGALAPVENWNVSSGKDFNSMFAVNNITRLTKVANWNVTNGTDFGGMFESNTIRDLTPIANWNVANGINFSAMFQNNMIYDVNSVNGWNVANGQIFSYMFGGNNLTKVNLQNWNTQSGIDFNNMFTANTINDLSGIAHWNVSNGQWFHQMFAYNQLINVDLNDINVTNAKDLSGFFANNQTLKSVDISNWNMNNVMSNLNDAPFPNKSEASGTKDMFAGDSTLYILKIGNGAKFFSDTNLVIPAHDEAIPDGSSHKATGKWQEEGNAQNFADPQGTVWDGDYSHLTTGTWTWQPEKQQVNITYVDDVTNQSITVPAEDATAGGLVGDSAKNASDALANGIQNVVSNNNLLEDKVNGSIPANYDSENPINITVHFKAATQDVTEQANGTLTVNYHYNDVNGNQAADPQTVTVPFTRHGVKNLKTGETKWDAWTPDNNANPDVTINSPQIKGYTPDQASVSDNLSAGANDIKNVIYTADNEQAHIQYIDKDNNDQILANDTLNGKFDQKADYSTKDKIAYYEAHGYELVTDEYPIDGYTYTTDDPTFRVVFKHKTKTVTPDTPGTPGQPVDPNNPDGPKYPDGTDKSDLVKDLTRTIHYKYADGTEAAKDVVEQVKYTRSITFDEVTGKLIETTNWASDNPDYAQIDSPVIYGYTPDQAKIDQEATKPTDTNSEATVTYHANVEQAQVQYVDDVTGKVVPDSQITDLSGHFGDKIQKNDIDDQILAIEGDGYKYVSGLKNIPKTFDFDGTTPMYTIHFTHNHSVATDDSGLGSVTVHYEYDNGEPIKGLADVTQTASFTRSGDKDDVTGDIVWHSWTPIDDTTINVQSPNLTGYTPDKSDVTDSIKVNTNKTDVVKYTANDEQANVQYIDQDADDKVLASDTLNGEFDQKADYSTKDKIAYYEENGYDLVSDEYPVEGYTYTEGKPTFVVTLKHKTKTVTPDNPGTPGHPVNPDNPTGPKYPDGTSESDLVKTITRTIHYKDNQGKTVSQDVVETTKFMHNITFDEVTGKIIDNGTWVAVNDTYNAVNSPVINGYFTDTPVVDAQTVNVDTSNSEVTVFYHPLGHLIPDVPGSTPVIYPNIPNKPNQAGDPIIPDIPGYTPVDGNGNKLKPGTTYPIDHNDIGKDTPIHYVKNEVPAPVTPKTGTIVIHYTDQNGNPIHDDTDFDGTIGDSYTLKPLEINGYLYDHSTGLPLTGIMNADGSITMVYTREAPAEPAKKQTPDKPQIQTPVQNVEAPAVKTPASEKAEPAQPAAQTETPKTQPIQAQAKAEPAQTKNALPQTGQSEQSSILSMIGALLVSFLTLLGLGGIFKKKESK